MRHKVHIDPEKHKEADQYFPAYLRELSPRKQDVARITRDFVKQGIYPSGKRVCDCMGRRGLDQSENGVRYKVMHAYDGCEGVIQAWRKTYYRAMTRTGIMFKEEIFPE